MYYLKITNTLQSIFHYLQWSVASDISIALTILKESQTQPKMLNVSMDNAMQGKIYNVHRKLFASKIRQQFQVALY